jgi:hypothetical protein
VEAEVAVGESFDEVAVVVGAVVVPGAEELAVGEVGAAALGPGFAVVVGSAWGAVSGLLRVRFPRPPSEPDVRLSPHPALHEVMPVGW